MTEPAPDVPRVNHPLIDAVLLIDADNDPHVPPDYAITERTLVRLFLRTDMKAPRALERKLGSLPYCVTVRSTKGGANASDFGMSLHAGILHATLPMHLPFTFVTADKALGVMVQELQRLGRVASIWSSHPERAARPEAAPARRRTGRSRRSGRSRPVAEPAPAAEAPAAAPAEGATLEKVTASYAGRLARVKGAPSRLKTLLNDIKNRALASGFTPEQILEELKRLGAVAVDDKGRVHYPPKA